MPSAGGGGFHTAVLMPDYLHFTLFLSLVVCIPLSRCLHFLWRFQRHGFSPHSSGLCPRWRSAGVRRTRTDSPWVGGFLWCDPLFRTHTEQNSLVQCIVKHAVVNKQMYFQGRQMKPMSVSDMLKPNYGRVLGYEGKTIFLILPRVDKMLLNPC